MAVSYIEGGRCAPRSVSPNEAGERYTISVHTVLIDPETKGHSRHQFQRSDCATGYTEIEVGVAVLECSNHRSILDARLNLSDGATVALWGLDQFDAVLIGADLGESDGGVDGHGLFVVDSVILGAGGGRRGAGSATPSIVHQMALVPLATHRARRIVLALATASAARPSASACFFRGER